MTENSVKRVNVTLPPSQHAAVVALLARDETFSGAVREALDAWLAERGVTVSYEVADTRFKTKQETE